MLQKIQGLNLNIILKYYKHYHSQQNSSEQTNLEIIS